MRIVIDTSAIIAVITNESHKAKIVNITRGSDLIAPTSIPCEIANAFSAMFKQKRISLEVSLKCVELLEWAFFTDSFGEMKKIPDRILNK